MRSKTTIECLQTEISGWTLPETFINEHSQDFSPFRDRNTIGIILKFKNMEGKFKIVLITYFTVIICEQF